MSQTESQGPDRTMQELVDLMRKTYKQEGKTFHTLEYALRRVLEVYPDLRESQVTEQHFDDYPQKRRELPPAPGKKVRKKASEKTILNEKNAFRRLFTFESDRAGCLSGEAAERAEMNWHTLHRLEKAGFFKPSIQPKVRCARGPRTGRWSKNDIEALRTYKALRDAGISKQALKDVGANLRKQCPELATDGDCNNEAFFRTQLEERYRDVCKPTPDGGYISWLHLSGKELPHDENTVGGFCEHSYLAALKEEPRVNERVFKIYVGQLRKHIYPTFGHRRFGEVQGLVQGFAEAKVDEGNEPETVEDWLGLLRRLLEHARRKGLYDGPVIDTSVSGLRKRRSEHLPFPLHKIREFSSAVKKPLDIWFLLRALVGLPVREVTALRWCDVDYDSAIPTLRIEYELKHRPRGVEPVKDRNLRDQPFSKVIADMLKAWHQELEEIGECGKYVFANKTGDGPLDPHNIYNRYLNDVADELRIPRRALYNLESIFVALAETHDLPTDLRKRVLRLPPRPPNAPPSVTPRQFEQTYEFLNRMTDDVLGTSTAKASDPTPEAESARTPPPADAPSARPTLKDLLAIALRVSTQSYEVAAHRMKFSERHLADILNGKVTSPRSQKVRKGIKRYLKLYLPEDLKKNLLEILDF